jgi:hypothetical protein
MGLVVVLESRLRRRVEQQLKVRVYGGAARQIEIFGEQRGRVRSALIVLCRLTARKVMVYGETRPDR